MKLLVNRSSYLSDIQKEFHRMFPERKLEFKFDGAEGLDLSARLSNSFPHIAIKELCQKCPNEDLSIDSSMTIEQVETLFKRIFGIPVQVYIRQGIYWLRNSTFNSMKLSA